MKSQKRKLDLILKFIDVDMFYTIGINKFNIQLQANYSPETAKKLSKVFDLKYNNSHGYLTGNRYNITVTLT